MEWNTTCSGDPAAGTGGVTDSCGVGPVIAKEAGGVGYVVAARSCLYIAIALSVGVADSGVIGPDSGKDKGGVGYVVAAGSCASTEIASTGVASEHGPGGHTGCGFCSGVAKCIVLHRISRGCWSASSKKRLYCMSKGCIESWFSSYSLKSSRGP